MNYRAELDGLRGLAVSAVVINHIMPEWLPGGFLGVDIFFAISGYVITGSILRSAGERLHPSPGHFLADFYRRRVQRLIPALAVFVAVTAALTCMVDPEPEASLLTGLSAMFGVSNLFLYQESVDYFGSDALYNTFTHTWSLGVEEQFYLFFPLLAWFLLGMGRSGSLTIRRYMAGIGLIGLLSLGWFVMQEPGDVAAYFLTQGRLWEIAAGCLLHIMLHGTGNDGPHRHRLPATLVRCPAWAPLLVLISVQFLPASSATVATILTIAASCVLIGALMQKSLVKNLLLIGWIRHIGLISYSLYLWHWSVLTLSRWTIGIHGWTIPLQLVLMVVLADASWRYLENPLRRIRWAGTAWQTIALGVGVNGLLAIPLTVAAAGEQGRHLFLGEPAQSSELKALSQSIPGTSIDRRTCLIPNSRPIDAGVLERTLQSCSTAELDTPQPGVRRIFLLGDSHASSLLPLARRLHQRGFAITMLARQGCPFPEVGTDHDQQGCREFHTFSEQTVLQRGQAGDMAIIAGYHLSHLGDTTTPDQRNEFLDRAGRPIRGGEAKLALYADAVRRFQAAAARRGIQVVLVGAGPRLLDRDRCLPEWFRPEGVLRDCSANLAQDLERARRLNSQLQERLPQVDILDAEKLICRQGCSLSAMRELLQDDDHLAEGAMDRLEQPLLTLLEKEGRLSPRDRPSPPQGSRP
ncbi:acyltransferase family protein [Synechococcus sp. CCY 9618]|uniref:acyltransferase family protein n=1 Tax=Synechococcus sp. CCY 9618 TaxID=2815602 RepID=UPI001C24DACB|nr:acyltransferase family protein [Synechococcus sp. CCY 9618]